MMKKLLWYIQVLLCFTALHSCISKSDIELDIPVQQKEIIVECYLTPGQPAELTLFENNTLQEELIIVDPGKANVYIITDTGAFQLTDVWYRNDNRHLFINYSSKDTIGEHHTFFNLDITTSQGNKLQASTGIVPQVQIQNVSIGDHEVTVCHNLDNSSDRYFRLVASTFKGGKHQETKFEIYQQSKGMTNAFTLPWKNIKADADSVYVTLFHIQKEYYDYLRSVRFANSAYKDPFLNPEAIRSNIRGGIGIFTYYTFDRRGRGI